MVTSGVAGQFSQIDPDRRVIPIRSEGIPLFTSRDQRERFTIRSNRA